MSIQVPIVFFGRGMRYSACSEDFTVSSLLESVILLDIRLTVFELHASMAVNMLIATQAINSSRNMQSKCLTQLKRQSARLIQLHTALLPHHRTAQGPEVEVVST